MLSGFTPRPLKRLFTANQCWTSFLDAGGLRDIEVEAVTKMLACGTRILGVKEFGCDNPDCQHVKYLTNSCGSRGTVAKLAMRQPFVLFKGLTFQKLCL
ncbi:transposase zinc-binding domain-containing protein, partial [Klebsiella pneumoniae]